MRTCKPFLQKLYVRQKPGLLLSITTLFLNAISFIPQEIQYCSSDSNWKQNLLFCHIRTIFSLDLNCFVWNYFFCFSFKWSYKFCKSLQKWKILAFFVKFYFKNIFQRTYYTRFRTNIFENTFCGLIWITCIYINLISDFFFYDKFIQYD